MTSSAPGRIGPSDRASVPYSDTHTDTSSVSHFVGTSLIETRTGDISTIVAGAFDLDTGKFPKGTFGSDHAPA